MEIYFNTFGEVIYVWCITFGPVIYIYIDRCILILVIISKVNKREAAGRSNQTSPGYGDAVQYWGAVQRIIALCKAV